MKEVNHLQTPRHKWKNNIRSNVKEIVRECATWIDLAQVRDKWLALVNNIMNFHVTLIAGSFCIICKLSAAEGRLCFMHLVLCLRHFTLQND